MASTVSNKIKYLLATGTINFSSDTFVLIYMKSGFVFNKDTHHYYADISANELDTAYGYTKKTLVLSGIAITEDDSNDRCSITWNSVSVTASGGDLGPSPGFAVIDDTAASDPIIGYVDFGGNLTQVEGGTGTVSGITFRIS